MNFLSSSQNLEIFTNMFYWQCILIVLKIQEGDGMDD